MPGEEIIANLSSILPESIFKNLNFLLKILQAIGGFIILYLIFQIINVIFRRRENRILKKISKNLEEIKDILKSKNVKIKENKKIKK